MEDKLIRYRKTMESFRGLIGREKECAKKIAPSLKQWEADLDAAIERTKDSFTVVIMGNFSSGKTTMINALIGERLLPMSATPTTAVMTELHYGENKKIVLYPKKGTDVDGKGDRPFTVPATTEAIERYITIDNEAGINSKLDDSVKIASQFEKMELYWPLDILKGGVVIVDSPGLNDPYSNDIIVRQYLPHADAVIYAMNSTCPYQGTDRKELECLNDYKLNNIIFAYTYWDQVTFDGEKTTQKTRTYCVQNALKHTGLGEKAIHFLASRDGLRAQIEKDQDMLVKSGYAEFIAFLAEYLTSYSGKDKVKNLVGTMEVEATVMRKHVAVLNCNAEKKKDDIKEKVQIENEKLADRKRESEGTLEKFKLKLQSQRPKVENDIKNAMREIKGKISLDNFTPETEFRKGLGKLNPFGRNKISEKITKEFQDEYNRRLEKEIYKVNSSTVFNSMKAAVSFAADSVKNDVEDLSRGLDDIDASLGVPKAQVEGGSGEEGNAILGVVYGMLTGDWWTGGSIVLYGGAGIQIGLQLGTSVGLGIAVALGAPITIPFAVGALIVSNFVAILVENNDKKIEKLRKTALLALEKACFDEGDDKFINPTANQIMERVDSIFDVASNNLKKAIDITITDKKKVFESMLEQANMSQEELNKAIQQRNSAVEELDKIIMEANTLQTNY